MTGFVTDNWELVAAMRKAREGLLRARGRHEATSTRVVGVKGAVRPFVNFRRPRGQRRHKQKCDKKVRLWDVNSDPEK